MKHLILATLLSFSFITGIGAHAGHSHSKEQHSYTEIHTAQLKEWYDQGKKMVVVDARPKKFFDGTLLPKAILIPHNAEMATVNKMLPSKDSLIVVYCSNKDCPASKMLANRLVSDGYTNVYKYPEGLQEWLDKGYPTEKG